MTSTIALSIQDLVPIAEGTDTNEALEQTRTLARLGDALGFTRLWYAEHHGMASIASSSPEVLIASGAAVTSAIRVGSGGVMLPNHVPLRVAETYRTLAGLYPGRIDLGIGRAGGSDARTLAALRSFGGEHFAEQMAELLAFEEGGFPEGHPFADVKVVPERVALPPIWLLGSSGASAQMAGSLGIGYGFAAHFSPTPAGPAFEAYRRAFRPSDNFARPHAILCLSALCAPSTDEANFLSGPQTLGWVLLRSGRARKLVRPEEAAAYSYTPEDLALIESQQRLWIVGDPETVKARIMAKVEETGADEVMITTTMHSYADRLRSYRLLAEAFGLDPRSGQSPAKGGR